MAQIKTEIWTKELVKTLSQKHKDSFLSKVPDYSRYAKNDVIHLVDVGGEPDVLINNTTYPISVGQRTDADIAISLDKFDSKNTKVTDDELLSIIYNKIQSVQQDHVQAIAKKEKEKYLHALAPNTDSSDTPIVPTTGAAQDGLKVITIQDLLSLKQKFDDLEVDEEGRVLVLSPHHQNQMLSLSQTYANQYYEYKRGKLVPFLFGFEIHSHVSTPHFHRNGKTGKLSFGAAVTSDYLRGSVAFYAPHCFKAKGTVKMYYKDAKTNPEYRESVIGFRTRSIALPKKNRYIGAIISVKP